MREINTNLLLPNIQKFIINNLNTDVTDLALKYKEIDGVPIQQILNQIQGKQKAKSKLPSWYHNPGIIYPPSISLEQCSSETTSKYKASIIKGKSLVDLTGGFGVDTVAFSKEFNEVRYVEQNEELCALAKHNFKEMSADNVGIFNSKAEDFLKDLETTDCIFIDPARRDVGNNKVVMLEDCDPDVVNLLPTLLSKCQQLLIKASPLLDIKAALTRLHGFVTQIHVVAVSNECKEVLYLLKNELIRDPQIFTLNIHGNQLQEFNFLYKEEEYAVSDLSEPLKYLYEPNSAILKAGAFNSITTRFKAKKLHKNTHLYTSNNIIVDFPGRKFEIEGLVKYDKNSVSKFIKTDRANITTRNFSDSIEKIRKKLDLKDGGQHYLFATMDLSSKYVIVVCKKLLSNFNSV